MDDGFWHRSLPRRHGEEGAQRKSISPEAPSTHSATKLTSASLLGDCIVRSKLKSKLESFFSSKSEVLLALRTWVLLNTFTSSHHRLENRQTVRHLTAPSGFLASKQMSQATEDLLTSRKEFWLAAGEDLTAGGMGPAGTRVHSSK